MQMLEFLNPTFRVDSNVTVRKGRKWAEKLKKGDTILVGQMAMATVLPARVTDIRFVDKVVDIPEFQIMREHDPDCRTYTGLGAELKRIYGKDYQSDGLTVVEFELLGGAPRPLIIDNRDIVADAKAVLRDIAGKLVYEAQATMEGGDVQTANKMSDDAGNLNELASLLKSRQAGLMILLKYGGGGPKYLVEPGSLAEMQRAIDEATPPPGDVPTELLDEHSGAGEHCGSCDEAAPPPGDAPVELLEGNPVEGVQASSDELVEDPDPYPVGYGEDLGEDAAFVSEDGVHDEEQVVVDHEPETSITIEIPDSEDEPDGDVDDEMLCYRCKDPVADPGEACADCQEEIDAEANED